MGRPVGKNSKKNTGLDVGEPCRRVIHACLRIFESAGFRYVAASLFVIWFLFYKIYPDTVAALPALEYDPVRTMYLWIIRLGCAFLVFMGVFLWRTKKRPSWLFPAAVLGLGLFYMAVLTPFSAPDEAVHFVTAYRMSSQMMGKEDLIGKDFAAHATEEEQEALQKGGAVLVREGDARKEPYDDVDRDSYLLALTELGKRDESSRMSVRPEIPVSTTPVVYLPQSLGFVAARLLHLGYVPLIYLGRLFNLLAFAGLVFLAVRIMPFKKEVLMAVSLLPMTLHLASSLSYDGTVIGLSMIFTAWCLHLAYVKEKVTPKDVALLALLLVLFMPCKIVYLPLSGLCLLIPASKFRSKKEYWISAAAVLFFMLLSVFLINRVVLSAWSTSTENYVSWSEASGYTFSDLLSHPYQSFRIYYETVATQLDYYQEMMLGGYLGNLDPDLNVPPFCLYLLWGVMFVCAVRRGDEKTAMNGKEKAWVVFLLAVSFGLILTSMLIGWTPADSAIVLGIQGRYFLPLLPLMLLLLYGGNLTMKKDVTKGAFYLECFVNVYAFIRICSAACVRY